MVSVPPKKHTCPFHCPADPSPGAPAWSWTEVFDFSPTTGDLLAGPGNVMPEPDGVRRGPDKQRVIPFNVILCCIFLPSPGYPLLSECQVMPEDGKQHLVRIRCHGIEDDRLKSGRRSFSIADNHRSPISINGHGFAENHRVIPSAAVKIGPNPQLPVDRGGIIPL